MLAMFARRSNDPAVVAPSGVCGMTLNMVTSSGGYVIASSHNHNYHHNNDDRNDRNHRGNDRSDRKGDDGGDDTGAGDGVDGDESDRSGWLQWHHEYYVAVNWLHLHWQEVALSLAGMCCMISFLLLFVVVCGSNKTWERRTTRSPQHYQPIR